MLPSPAEVHRFWFGPDARVPEVLQTKAKLWFNGGPDFDRELTDRFLPLLETLAAGPMAHDWAARGAQERLAAILVLDQMSRNIFRGNSRAFAQDGLALGLCKEGLAKGEDNAFAEVERVFFYLPLEHSEAMDDQERAIALFDKLAKNARAPFADFAKMTLTYARQHRDVIARFGRFPHRNAALGRASTPEEQDWLAEGGGF